MIDHHPLRKASFKAQFRDVRPDYGATSTIVTEYLVAADLTPTRSVANALLYGIKTDTNSLVRGASNADFQAFSYLFPLTNPRVLGWIEKPALSSEYLEEYQRGLARTILHRDVAVSYLGKIQSEAIMPELADLLLRLDGISWSLCLGERGNLMIVSCRSTARSYKAGTVLRRTIGNNGSAGGHRGMMTHFSKIDAAKYYGIALIDAQPGTTNNLIASLRESPLIVIDHHPLRKLTSKAHFRDIRPNYGATSTIVTEYLVAADLTPTRSVANALLYGIKTDTNSLVRGASDADFRAFTYLFPLTNPRVLGCIEKPVLSSEYLDEYQRGLARTNIHRDVAISYLGKIKSEAIVPELADLLLRLDGISWSLCLGERGNLLIISCRSTARSYKAGNVLRRIVGDNGSAGGHRRMAGGQVPLNGLKPEDRKEIATKLITRFLRAIKREGTQPRPIFGRRVMPPSPRKLERSRSLFVKPTVAPAPQDNTRWTSRF